MSERPHGLFSLIQPQKNIVRIAETLQAEGWALSAYAPLDISPITRFAARFAAPTTPLGRFLEKGAFTPRARTLAPFEQAAFSVAYRLGRDERGAAFWRGPALDRRVASRLARERPALFLGQMGAARLSFQRARRLGIPTFYYLNAMPWRENVAVRRELREAPTRLERKELRHILWPAWFDLQVRAELGAAGTIFVQSPYVRDELTRAGFDPARFAELPNGVDSHLFRPAHREPGVRPLRVLSVGTVGYRKGLRYAGEGVRRAGPAVESWRVVGGPDFKASGLRPYMESATLVGRHAHEDLAAEYARADVFLLPSFSESMSRAVLEAMAAGMAVVVTEGTGYKGILDQGTSGFFVGDQDADGIASILTRLSEDPELRESAGRSARAIAERYTWDRWRSCLLAGVHRGLDRAERANG